MIRIKRKIIAGQKFTLSLDPTDPIEWHLPDRDTQDGPTATEKYEQPAVRIIRGTFEIELDVQPAEVPKPPTPQPTGVLVKSGGNLQAAVDKGGIVNVECGGSYPKDITITRNDTSIIAVGTGARPKLGRIVAYGRKRLAFEGIQPIAINLYGCEDAAIRKFEISKSATNGINLLDNNGAKCLRITIEDFLVADCYPTGDGHRQGIYAQKTDYLTIRRGVLDGNGWDRTKPKTATEYNHNIYIHASCGDNITIEDLVCANASAHGIQARAGGTLRNIIFIDCPIGMSVGLVNDSPCHDGGVKATVENIVYIGGRDIQGGDSPGKRGWAMEIDNTKSVKVSGVYVDNDNQFKSEAIHVGGSRKPTGEYVGCKPGTLKISEVQVGKWTKGAYSGWVASEPIIKIPADVDLRRTLGDRFVAEARANPSTAAAIGFERIRTTRAL